MSSPMSPCLSVFVAAIAMHWPDSQWFEDALRARAVVRTTDATAETSRDRVDSGASGKLRIKIEVSGAVRRWQETGDQKQEQAGTERRSSRRDHVVMRIDNNDDRFAMRNKSDPKRAATRQV